MVERYLDLSATGVYSIAFFFGTLVLIPSRPLTRISAIIVADSFKKNDLNNIDLIYKKSSITLTIIAMLLFLGLAINMDNIMQLIGEDYRAGYYVILLIAFANVIQMSSGVINQVIFNSEYYKYSSYFILVFAALVTFSNMIFIPKYGILGAAIATLISKAIYIFSRILFVKAKLNLNPYQLKTLIPIIVSVVLYILQTYIPPFNHFMIDIILRSTIIGISFVTLIYIFNVSEDINQWINNFVKKVFQK
jgi:O-antigen/teichoic acid export membrane protein